jgi:queuosine precursor transporter
MVVFFDKSTEPSVSKRSMNEFIFIIHIFLVLGFGLGALRLGREALICWVAIQALLANLFVIKQIFFFGFEVTCSDVFAVGCLLGLNLLQEYFGKESAKKAGWICFFTLLFFAAMSQVHLAYFPSPHDTTQQAFIDILSPAPRLLIASLVTFIIVQQCDLRLFQKLRAHLPSFSLRSGISICLSQLLDTALFSFLGLYGLVNSLFDIVFISFLIKFLIILFMTPFTTFAKKCLPSN